MTHTVYTVGYVVKEGGKGFMFTADTGPTKRFWEVAGEEKGIEFIIADVSFPNRLENIARISGHMTMSILIEHLDRFGLGDMQVYIDHIKPIFLNEILNELKASDRANIKPLEQGAILQL
jgi:ribonuclease BN (tRNA processing enzyme)